MPTRRSFRAGDGLVVTGVDQAWMSTVLTRIDPAHISVREASPWFLRLWAPGIVAVAMPWAIYLTPAMMDRYESGAEPHRLGKLLVHELVHIEQVKRLGILRHVVQYVTDYMRGRLARRGHWDSYRDVRLEVEARSVARLVMAGPR